MKTPRKVASLSRLVAQIDALYPKRSKASDGWLGDAKHAVRKSEHNPDADGSVDARDITHDPKNGPDIARLADALIAAKDRRVKNIIVNGQIIAGNNGPSPWVRRKYNGANKHTKHLHIDVLDKYQDDASDWKLAGLKVDTPVADMAMKEGDSGPLVSELQRNLIELDYMTSVTGVFDANTDDAVRAFQAANKDEDGKPLQTDGKVGLRTSKAISTALIAPTLKQAEKAIPAAATKAVDEKAGFVQKVGGWVTGGGLTAGIATQAFGSDWKTVLAIGGLALVGVAIFGAGWLLKSWIKGDFKSINEDAKS